MWSVNLPYFNVVRLLFVVCYIVLLSFKKKKRVIVVVRDHV